MSQTEIAIEKFLEVLSPLRELGILCRTVSDSPAKAGRLERNGTITVAYAGDVGFQNTDNLGAISQSYSSQFVLLGRLKNLRSVEGVYAVRDALYTRTVGLRIPGFAKAVRAVSFIPTGQAQGRQETHWGFEYTASVEGYRPICLDGLEELGEQPLDSPAQLLSKLFVEVTVSDQWNISKGTINVDS